MVLDERLDGGVGDLRQRLRAGAKPAKRLWDIKKAVPLFDIAAPLIDLHSLYEGGRWDHILSAPEQIHVVLNTTFNFGDLRETPSDGQGR